MVAGLVANRASQMYNLQTETTENIDSDKFRLNTIFKFKTVSIDIEISLYKLSSNQQNSVWEWHLYHKFDSSSACENLKANY